MAKKPVETPVAVCSRLFCDPMKLAVIDLLMNSNLSLKALVDKVPGASEQQMEECLQQLIDDDLVKKVVISAMRGKVEYSLSMVGDTLEPVFDELRKWGEGYQRMVDAYVVQ